MICRLQLALKSNENLYHFLLILKLSQLLRFCCSYAALYSELASFFPAVAGFLMAENDASGLDFCSTFIPSWAT